MKSKLSLIGAAVVLTLLMFGLGGCYLPPLCTATLNVTTTIDSNDGACTAEHCSLREAIIRANAYAGLQTINVPAGTYQLTLTGAEEDVAATGDLDITGDLILQGTDMPVIDGVASDRIFEIFSPATVQINQFVLINGQAQLGGAIRSHGTLTVNDSSIHNNVAVVPPGGAGGSSGGGVFVEAGTTTLINTDVFENSGDFGGGVHNFATATFQMTGGHLRDNTASGWGGGLWNNMAAQTTLESVDITRNTAERGAGVYNNGSFESNLVTFEENVTSGEGGGFFNDENGEAYLTLAWFTNNNAQVGGGLYNIGLLHLYQSSLTNNSALGGQGGGAYNDGAAAALLVQNTTISGNMVASLAISSGSGIYNNGGDLRLEFSTLAYNNTDGVDNAGGHVSLRDTILAYHAYGNCAGSAFDSLGYNIEDGNTCGFDEPSDLADTDPLLAWLDMNGGSNLSHALNPGSPAIDSGNPDLCIAIDQRGISRPQGAGCDRGAYEVETGISSAPTIPAALALVNANCRHGPGMDYESMAMLTEGQSYEINGRDDYDTWWQVVLPTGEFCWVGDSVVETSGDVDSVAVIQVAAAETDTPTPVVGCWVYSATGKLTCTSPCPANPKPGGACTP